MRILSGQNAVRTVERLASRATSLAALEPRVRAIIKDVRRNGDRALRRYAVLWDGLAKNQPLQVPAEEMAAAWNTLAPSTRQSLREAAQNICRFCEWQKPRSWTRTRRGISLGQLAIPLDSVGCYVPGGRYPLVSTLLMTVIPAQVAGVENIRVVSPKPSTEVLAAAGMLGVQKFYRVGGAQAIAALAYGTKTSAGERPARRKFGRPVAVERDAADPGDDPLPHVAVEMEQEVPHAVAVFVGTGPDFLIGE